MSYFGSLFGASVVPAGLMATLLYVGAQVATSDTYALATAGLAALQIFAACVGIGMEQFGLLDEYKKKNPSTQGDALWEHSPPLYRRHAVVRYMADLFLYAVIVHDVTILVQLPESQRVRSIGEQSLYFVMLLYIVDLGMNATGSEDRRRAVSDSYNVIVALITVLFFGHGLAPILLEWEVGGAMIVQLLVIVCLVHCAYVRYYDKGSPAWYFLTYAFFAVLLFGIWLADLTFFGAKPSRPLEIAHVAAAGMALAFFLVNHLYGIYRHTIGLPTDGEVLSGPYFYMPTSVAAFAAATFEAHVGAGEVVLLVLSAIIISAIMRLLVPSRLSTIVFLHMAHYLYALIFPVFLSIGQILGDEETEAKHGAITITMDVLFRYLPYYMAASAIVITNHHSLVQERMDNVASLMLYSGVLFVVLTGAPENETLLVVACITQFVATYVVFFTLPKSKPPPIEGDDEQDL